MYFLAEVLIILFAIALVVYVTRWGRRRYGPWSPWPWVLGAGAFVIVFMGEELAGRAQMLVVCPTAKVEVYGSVEVPAFFYDSSGQPLFLKSDASPDYDKLFGPVALKERLGHYLETRSRSQRSLFLKRTVSCFREKATARELACAERYILLGGWTKELINVDFFGLPACGSYIDFRDVGSRIVKSRY